MNTITDKNEVKKWEEVKKIQEDWINRLVDQNSLDYQMIRSAVVIAGTCVGFLSNEVIKDMSFDYVIIDEAAKATTPELLVSIIKAKKIILVGDQNQLPAYADAEVSPTLAKLTKNPDYRLFDILYNSLPDTHKQILTTQYRMIENIGNLISKVFYRGIIDTGCNDDEKRHGLSRYKLKNRSGKNNSQQGTDVIAYKYKNEDKTPNDKDELVAAEVKATLSNMEYTPIKNAIIDSRKDEHRLARSVNYCRKRLKELGKIEEAEEVKRFLFKPDNNYRITYVAAGVSSRENVDDAIELGFSGEELEIRKNELIFYVHGQKLMELAHNIYQRCCK